MPIKSIIKSLLSFFIIGTFIFLSSCTQEKEPVEVYIMRHTEKTVWDNPDTTAVYDPDLSSVGRERAQKLVEVFNDRDIAAIYSTEFKRNMGTVLPLAEKRGIEIREYEAHDWGDMLEEIGVEFRGKSVLICGHRNNIFNLISAMNGTPPQDSLAEYEYDKIFHLKWSENNTEVRTITF